MNDAPDALVRHAGPAAPATGSLLGVPAARWRALMQRELGLPEGLVIGTGHQPEWWHPGIMAKFLWAAESARGQGASVAWLIVDTDVRDPGELRLPVVRGGILAQALHRLGPRTAPGTAPAARPARVPAPYDGSAGEPALPCVAEGIAAAHDALLEHADAPDLVAQMTGALLRATPGLEAPAATVRSSRLMGTTLGRALLDRAAADPAACARAFNEAVRLVPRVARRLEEHGASGPELPIWTADPDGARRPVRAADLARLRDGGAPLWPRAFLTSAIARAALCDRFVHGTGGGTYERATEAFAAAWLGAALPPFDVVSATVRLPFPEDPGAPPVTHAARRSRWFDPQSVGAGPSEWKREALARIAALPRRSAARRAAWRAMHEELARIRSAHACGFMELDAQAAADLERARSAAVRADRTWACVLHPRGSVTALAAALRRHLR